jgi:hypothetical protein
LSYDLKKARTRCCFIVMINKKGWNQFDRLM